MTLTRINTNSITDGSIVNADINTSAAIAGTKISPDFGSQNIITTGRLGLGTSSPQSLLNISSTNPVFTLTRNNNTNASGAINFAGTDNVVKWQIGTNQSTGVGFEINRGDSTNNALYIDASNRVGIGTASPSTALDVVGNINSSFLKRIRNDSTGGSAQAGQIISAAGRDVSYVVNYSGQFAVESGTSISTKYTDFDAHIWRSNSGTERARIDSSGRLLVGTSSARANFYNSTLTAGLQVEGTGGASSRAAISVINNDVGDNPAYVVLGRSRTASIGSNTALQNGDWIGILSFQGNDGTEFVEAARIDGIVDGTPGANDMPGRLVFSTTADGASSPTERMRIANNGAISTVVPGGSTLYPAYDCRAWVNFNGTGTVSIRGNGNVSSITDNGTGDYTVNFTTALTDANYSVVGIAGTPGSTAGTLHAPITTSGNQTTGYLRLGTYNESGLQFDASFANVAIFR